ncbi:GlxA family transcriptional regulator [Vibrio salinus]|uniref:GlxA family transcriptional regulator n=1 Tax=Vibrio salinus TaxID=2899784 RepID=UPI001E38533C|nr:helix-turn-helix domain-containing protein [Vibrio salinus]MCE0494272.1 helix-turn-helix domain-containing protein [Vibrio salinus]
MTTITIAILHYPNVLRSALYGLEEMFLIANTFSQTETILKPDIIKTEALLPDKLYHIIILPPALSGYEKARDNVIKWLNQQHQNGAVIASGCAGAFIMAQTDCIKGRTITTHWNLVKKFRAEFPQQPVDENQLLINHGDIIASGGLMSWIDLGLEIVRTRLSDNIMRQLGKTLVIDTAAREQRCYCQFRPEFGHGDNTIIAIQHYIHQYFSSVLSISALAALFHLTERTLHRRFCKATSLSPKQYQQKLRVQTACDLLENTNTPVEKIAHSVGYEDTSAFRRIFNEQTGISPKTFRQRFRGETQNNPTNQS